MYNIKRVFYLKLKLVVKEISGDPDDPKVAAEMAKIQQMWKNTAQATKDQQAGNARREAEMYANSQRRLESQRLGWKALAQKGEAL